MFDSVVRAALAHKEIVIAATAFAVLTSYLSTIPTATAQVSVIVTPGGNVFIDFDDSYVRVVDGEVSISLDDLLNGLGGGLF
jgi:hypothetical protein